MKTNKKVAQFGHYLKTTVLLKQTGQLRVNQLGRFLTIRKRSSLVTHFRI